MVVALLTPSTSVRVAVIGIREVNPVGDRVDPDGVGTVSRRNCVRHELRLRRKAGKHQQEAQLEDQPIGGHPDGGRAPGSASATCNPNLP